MNEKDLGIDPLHGRLDRREFLRWSAYAGGAVLLGGCSGDEEPSAGTSEPASTNAAAPPSGSSAATLLTVGTAVIDDVINPLDEQYSTFQFNLFDTLVRLLPGMSEPAPRLATEWENVNDITWRFTLRDGVTFHDGSPLTAQDVAFSYQTVVENQYGMLQILTTLADVSAVDDMTVEVVTSAPDPLLLNRMGQMFIVPQAHWEDVGPDGFSQDPVGSGPYSLADFSPGEILEMERFADFWGDAPSTEQVALRYFSEVPALQSALEAGEIDAAHELSPAAGQTLDGNQDIELFPEFSGSQNMLQLNAAKAPFDSLAARQAAIMAVDVDALIEAITFGTGVKEDGQIPVESVFGYTSEISRPGYDPDMARTLVQQAGVEGAQVTLSGIDIFSSVLEAVGEQLRAVGFEPVIRAQEIPLWVEEFRGGSDAEIFYRGASYVGLYDADRPFTFVSFGDKPFVKDETWDGLFAAQRGDLDPSSREQKLVDCSQHILDNAYCLFTYGRPTIGATRSGTTGIDFATGLAIDLTNATKEA